MPMPFSGACNVDCSTISVIEPTSAFRTVLGNWIVKLAVWCGPPLEERTQQGASGHYLSL